MDEADIANDYAQRDLDMKLAEMRARQRTGGPEFCTRCSEPMPRLRRNLGLSMCIDCAHLAERAARRFGR